MGIKSLHQFLRKKCPELYQTIHLSDLAYKKVAVDVSLFMFKYKAIAGDKWLHAFINLILSLRRNNVHCYFVYDGPSPVEKLQEQQRRRDSKQKIQDRVDDLEKALVEYNKTGEILPIILATLKRRKSPPKLKSLLRPKKGPDIDIEWLEAYIERIKGQVIHLTPEDIQVSKDLFDILGVPYSTSLGEAETLCAHLSRDGNVYGALSEDTDLMACGSKVFLHKIDTRNDTCVVLKLEEVRNALELNPREFQDFCIMCGTDYNSNLPRIGPAGAYKLIKKHGNLDEFPKSIDITSLNHIRVRELFSSYPSEMFDVPFCGQPTWKKVSGFLFENNCHGTYSAIQNVMKPTEVVFDD